MFPTITSPQNSRVKSAVKLRDRHGRQDQGRFLIDGVREVARAAESGIALVEVFVCSSWLDPEALSIVQRLAAAAVPVSEVTPAVFAKLAFGDRAEGLVAVATTPAASLDAIILPRRPLVVVLEAAEKPGNVGAVLRTADAAGASAVIVADGGTDLYNPNAIRASLGAIFAVPVCAATSAETLAWLRRHRLAIHATRVDGAIAYTEATLTGPCAIVLGSEARGLSEVWRGNDVVEIALPMLGRVDSLNVSNTAAVLLYEALRQRRLAGEFGGSSK